MKKSKRLVPVRQIKQQEEKAAAQRLGEAQQGLNNAIKQLQELQQYRQDYYHSLSAGNEGNSSVPAAALEKYQLFLARLNGVVERQQETVEQYKQHVDSHRQKWAEANARLKSIDDLIERAKIEEEQLKDKQEQKAIDELSQHRKTQW